MHDLEHDIIDEEDLEDIRYDLRFIWLKNVFSAAIPIRTMLCDASIAGWS